ncbi:hypothetical protein KIS4809_3827 [Bacillus sp. ZZV12-4809]|nr:hypothetical protein KIS4809_3827 [Bacillus sp. ZZV12-4809]
MALYTASARFEYPLTQEFGQVCLAAQGLGSIALQTAGSFSR